MIKKSASLFGAKTASGEIGGQPEFPANFARAINAEHVQAVEITRNKAVLPAFYFPALVTDEKIIPGFQESLMTGGTVVLFARFFRGFFHVGLLSI